MTHHLVGASEIGELLGLTRQRVDQLANLDETFPKPQATIGRGVRVWSTHEVEEWARATRNHFCLPADEPGRNRGVTEIHCPTCGRNWVWQGNAWKNEVPPQTIEHSQ